MVRSDEIGPFAVDVPFRNQEWSRQVDRAMSRDGQAHRRPDCGPLHFSASEVSERKRLSRRREQFGRKAPSSHSVASEQALSAPATAHLAAILDHIARYFQEPELSVAAVAEAQGISPRYLQRLIQSAGTTFTGHVNELRLQRAFSLLTEARSTERRIADIALDAGFSDISHFIRLFRSRFGDTPSGVRAQRNKGR
jgi:AraC-like DNA-binding protein